VARWKYYMSPWRGAPLTIPPDSVRAWVRLAAWEVWMGILLYGALHFGTQLMITAPGNFVGLNVVLNFWCGWLLMLVAPFLLWELWSAVAPEPITDEFLTLLDDSFARDWRKPRTWPWGRVMWAYGFTLVGVTVAMGIGLLIPSTFAR
jgi:hypothetical protein